MAIKEELDSFYTDYFYDMSFNDKLCEAIQNISQTRDFKSSKTSKYLIEWRRNNCSSEAYERLRGVAEQSDDQERWSRYYTKNFHF